MKNLNIFKNYSLFIIKLLTNSKKYVSREI